MTQNFTPHINLITTKTPAITLLYTLLLSPISLLGNQAQLASAHSLAPLHNISSLSLSRVFADWLVRLSVSALVVTLPRAGLDWAPYRQQRVSRGGRVIRQTVVLTRLPALLTLSADLWQHWLYAACLTRLHLRLQNDNNGVQEEAKSSQNGYSLGCQTDLATSNWRDSLDCPAATPARLGWGSKSKLLICVSGYDLFSAEMPVLNQPRNLAYWVGLLC